VAASDRRPHCLPPEQLESLDHYLPETYQYLMVEMDQQQRELMEYKVKDFYWTQENEQQHKNPHS